MASTINSSSISTTTLDASIIGSSGFPAGHVLGFSQGIYTFTGDVGVTTTSEAWGPVVLLTLTKANANIYACYNVDEYYFSTTLSAVFNVVYKSSSFSAAQGNDSHGGTSVSYTHLRAHET